MPEVLLHPALFHAVVLMNLLFVLGAWSLSRPSYWAAGLLAICSVAWLFWNQPLEGRILISVTPEHGLTESDILSILGVAIAAVTFARTRERRRYEE